jgi:hypothetical protein
MRLARNVLDAVAAFFFVAFIGPDENDALESALAAIGTVRFPQTAGIGVTIRFE